MSCFLRKVQLEVRLQAMGAKRQKGSMAHMGVGCALKELLYLHLSEVYLFSAVLPINHRTSGIQDSCSTDPTPSPIEDK